MKKTDNMPDFVYLGLLGINTRATAYAYAIFCLLLSIGCLIYGFVEPIYFSGIGFVLAAIWYLYCIKWVDNNASWSE